MRILAIDFETGDRHADSAIAIGLAMVEDGRVAHRESHLIRPPRKEVRFTDIHGLTWRDVAHARDFAGLWPRICPLFESADLYAAHNAPFDRHVLGGTSGRYNILPPPRHWVCTVRLARTVWNVRPTRLPDVARHLCVTLNHHDALSDANACAEAVAAAMQEGHDLTPFTVPPYVPNLSADHWAA